MQLADPLAQAWKAELGLRFGRAEERTVLLEKRSDGPLVVQKPLYPEGDGVCHAIVVHPPGGIAGGDELHLDVKTAAGAHALLTTPGAGKWYRSAGLQAIQHLSFSCDGTVEWLPRETIVFDGALAGFHTDVSLQKDACFIGWEIVCLGRTGSGERFTRGRIDLETRIAREKKILFFERGRIDGGGRLMDSPAGLGGRSVFGTFIATCADPLKGFSTGNIATTFLPGLLVARYLGDSSEEALREFTRLWTAIRPAVTGREAVLPRIWST